MQEREAVQSLSALALDTRLRALRILIDAGEDGLPAGEVARLLNVPQNTLSDHLQLLARAGFASRRRQSRSIIYTANLGTLKEVIAFLEAMTSA